MIIHNVTQGSPEWHALRAQHFTASEAPAMMGASKYQSRSDLLKQKKTGLAAEVSQHQQALFNRGHAAEAAARLIVEEMIGEELYPVTATEGDLLASMDGMDMAETVLFEHKLWNADLVAQVRAGELEPHYYWQLEQQLLVSGAGRVIFVCSDGTRTNFVHMEYRPVAGRAEALQAGWRQFAADLDAFEVEAPKAEAVGRTPEHLPALHIKVTGMVEASNLAEFKATAMSVLAKINTDLTTDQEFADAALTVKWCENVEERLEAAKQHALSQTASIDELFRTIDEIAAETRAKRLTLDKLVKTQKEAIKLKIKGKAEQDFRDYVAAINQRLSKVQLPVIPVDFANAIKGKKTITGLQDGANGELARAKIEADNWAALIEKNLASLRELATDHAFLFSDAQQLVLKANDDLVLLINARIAEYKAEEERRLEAEREKKEVAAAQEPDTTPEPAPAAPAPARTAGYSRSATAPTTQWIARVTDKSALIAAIAAGYATDDLLIIDQAALDSLANSKGQTLNLPGVIVEKAPAKAA
ncbi:YqaJ viral recombinase family protein [Pseudomonas aeruginosa]|uniref:YqaJ viral recombinase family protein n=1 Tax=Pseudomonas aeruginosa TaxID=287 RepID=UPI002953D809|nr:YqaJ viral recombinase family protein [Pseudomonas aeruginosa]MDV8060143.1 YqaJ viral recombinase family protein [Pseudomonas aeruginosa]MDV8087920.1 YqaJ viral recombinase family protein [Pseudomonas aeruginosa]